MPTRQHILVVCSVSVVTAVVVVLVMHALGMGDNAVIAAGAAAGIASAVTSTNPKSPERRGNVSLRGRCPCFPVDAPRAANADDPAWLPSLSMAIS